MNDLSQRFDNRLEISVQCHVLLDSTDLQSVMFLARLLDLFRDFFTFAHISHIHSSEVSTTTDHVMILRIR